MQVEVPSFASGSLVSARGRTWVVMPSEDQDVLLLRPVDGSEDDAIGIFVPLEPDAVTGATYPPPNPDHAGDFSGSLLLRDAVRLTLRSGAGPFRSVGRLSVVPRPYQYVPLIMALRMDPVRLLIADDVGVGKTIEAGMIARELFDRGAVRRIGVLCPPHLCDQWARELADKFGIETSVIQPSQMARLERAVPRPDVHVFEHYPHLVASIDYVKSDRHRRAFVDNAPDLIIIDEAHTASRPKGDGTRTQQQRHRLLAELAEDPKRHFVLVTATPHSGVEESFRSLLGILDPALDLPVESKIPRRRLLLHMIQRRRSDLTDWLGANTPFPGRDDRERTYRMSREYSQLYESILDFCRQTVAGVDGRRQRVRYWAAISILRCVLSSPAAAEAALRKRAERKRREIEDDVSNEEEFATQILDSTSDQDSPPDYVPTSALDDPDTALTSDEVRRLETFLRRAHQLRGPEHDAKLAETRDAVEELLSEGYRPIVYCRFIDTAQYVAEQLQAMLGNRYSGLRVQSVTGGDGNEEQRREIVADLAASHMRVLVATDCLSEGINMQEDFDAVLHYDLPWNPNRLEQREGRVDRYGQGKSTVKTVLIWGQDNAIDQAVLRVLIRKAREIRARLGISVAGTVESDAVLEAVVDDIFMRRGGYQLTFDAEDTEAKVSEYHKAVDHAAERESQNRAYFAQHSIQPVEVERELREMEPALGSAADIERFMGNSIQRFNGELRATTTDGVFSLFPGSLEQLINRRFERSKFPMRVSFNGTPRQGTTQLGRNHPIVTALSDAVLDRALSEEDPLFARCGAIVTNDVERRTFVLLLRLRYLLHEDGRDQFAEEVVAAAFQRVAGAISWLNPYQEEALKLLSGAIDRASPEAWEIKDFVSEALRMLSGQDWAMPIIEQRVDALKASHNRLRGLVGGSSLDVRPHAQPDVLGCYVLIPSGAG